jgi:hypothetical protein
MEPLTLGIFGFVVTWWMVALWVLVPVASIALVCATVAAARRVRPTADPAAGSLVYRHPPLLRWGSVCFAVCGFSAVTAMVVVHPPKDGAEAIYFILAYAMFGSLAAALVWDVFRFRLVVGPEGLDCRSPWRRRRFIQWADVSVVSFNNPLGWFEVRATDGRLVRMPALVGGLGAFLEACEGRLAPGQLEPALSAYIFLGRTFPDEGNSSEDDLDS